MTTQPINRISREDVNDFKENVFHNIDSLTDYQRIATQSAIYPGQGTPFGVMYCALGLGEAGEIQNKVKKAFRDDGVIEMRSAQNPHDPDQGIIEFKRITPERKAAIMKEMGGNLWYLAALAKELDTTLSEIALGNLEELCDRGERNVLSGDGDDR